MVKSEKGFFALSLPGAIVHLPGVGWAACGDGRPARTFLSLIAEPSPRPEGKYVLKETDVLEASYISVSLHQHYCAGRARI